MPPRPRFPLAVTATAIESTPSSPSPGDDNGLMEMRRRVAKGVGLRTSEAGAVGRLGPGAGPIGGDDERSMGDDK